jgi:alkylated DNA nucleotide flippase Atl1
MAEIDDYSARVLDVVDAIPAGQVMSYGDVAEYLGAGGPRQVGRVMARYGGAAPWWRVIHADGTPAPGHDARALAHYLAEGTPLLSPGKTTPRTPRLSRRDGIDGKDEPAPTGRAAEGQQEPVRVRVDMRRARWRGTS